MTDAASSEGAAGSGMSAEARSQARRALYAIVLATAIFLWARHHFDLSTYWFFLAPALGMVKFAVNWISDKHKKEYKAAFQRTLHSFVDRDVLAVVTLAFVVAGSSLSSIRVYAAGADVRSGLSVQVVPDRGGEVMQQTLEDKGSFVRQWLLPGPFGSSYTVEVPGYRRTAFDVAPWRSTRVRITRDLAPLPTLFIRVPTEKQQNVRFGKVVLSCGGEVVAEVQTTEGSAAAKFGPRREIPPSWLLLYQLQARVKAGTGAAGAAGAADPGHNTEALYAQFLLNWLNPVHCEIERPIQEGDSLVAEYFEASRGTEAGSTPAARAEFTVGAVEFIDVLLEGGRP